MDIHKPSAPGLPGVSLEIEELRTNGFTVLRGVVDLAVLPEARQRLDAVYNQQVAEIGASVLAQTGEDNQARCPLSYDGFFLRFATIPQLTDLAHGMIGGQYVVLHLQNGIINRPHQAHHQRHWHRDLPYQEFVSTRPLAISALVCLDAFTAETGCTHVLPGSHRVETIPSEPYIQRHEYPVTADPGDAIVFDSMLFHRAGDNRSSQIRRGINHVYSVPLIRQQIELAGCLDMADDIYRDEAVHRLLALGMPIPRSVREFRQYRAARAGIHLDDRDASGPGPAPAATRPAGPQSSR